MSEKRDWYALASRIFGWEKNRKSKSNHFLTGFLVGALVSLYGGIVIATLVVTVINISLQSVGLFLLISTIMALMTTGVPVFYFGYKELKSITKQSIFKWGFAGGFCVGIIGWIIALLLNPSPVLSR
ncbi:MAG: hypothetical protein AAB577_01560 [Patescibacteria group bacterium]